MRQVIIVNPQSAGGQTRHRWPQFEAELRSGLGEFEARFTERPDHATELTRQALREGAERVIAMGGDGTIGEVINGFFEGEAAVRPGAAFAVLPAGTGGDFIRTLGLPRDLIAAARAIHSGTARTLDAGRVHYTGSDGTRALRYFVNIASFGISGMVMREVNRSSKMLGKATFLIASLRANFAYETAHCRLRFDGGPPLERPVYSCAIANCRYFGGGMMIAPNAEYDDGRFDVVTIEEAGLPTLLRHTPKIYSGTHIGLPFVKVDRAQRVEVEPPEGREVLLEIDGEQVGRLPATFEILPGALRVVM